jgi:hypothetical protein
MLPSIITGLMCALPYCVWLTGALAGEQPRDCVQRNAAHSDVNRLVIKTLRGLEIQDVVIPTADQGLLLRLHAAKPQAALEERHSIRIPAYRAPQVLLPGNADLRFRARTGGVGR